MDENADVPESRLVPKETNERCPSCKTPLVVSKNQIVKCPGCGSELSQKDRCPDCHSKNIKKLKMIYVQGISASNRTSTGMYTNLLRPVKGAGVFVGASEGVRQSALSNVATPPEPPSIAWLFLIVTIPVYVYLRQSYAAKLAQWERAWMCLSCGETFFWS